jgi:hypothetical protein
VLKGHPHTNKKSVRRDYSVIFLAAGQQQKSGRQGGLQKQKERGEKNKKERTGEKESRRKRTKQKDNPAHMKKSSFSVSRLAGAGTPAKVVCWFFFKDVDFLFFDTFFFFRIYARGCFFS